MKCEESDGVSHPGLRVMAVHERPQERMEKFGVQALSDTELVAMILRSGSKTKDVLQVAASIIRSAGCISGLLRFSSEDFERFAGVGRVRALQLVTVMEIARRALESNPNGAPILDDPLKVYDYMRPEAAGLAVEKFWVLCLNRKNRLIKRALITSGTATASLVHPREVFREAIRTGASGIICAHNHPSGDPSPSTADIRATRQLREAAATIQIDFLDHVIIGDRAMDPASTGYYSFADQGLV